MSIQQPAELDSLFAYNKARGLTDDEAAREAHATRVMRYAFLTQLLLGGALLLSAFLVTSTPWFANASGAERMNIMGWCVLGAMAFSGYLAFKAKSAALWFCDALLLIPVIYMICI